MIPVPTYPDYPYLVGNYTAILLNGDQILAGQLFQILGKGGIFSARELSFGATSVGHEGKGYFSTVSSCVQQLFETLHVQTAVLPSSSHAIKMWRKFHFRRCSTEMSRFYMEVLRVLVLDYECLLFHRFLTSSGEESLTYDESEHGDDNGSSNDANFMHSVVSFFHPDLSSDDESEDPSDYDFISGEDEVGEDGELEEDLSYDDESEDPSDMILSLVKKRWKRMAN
ncbi:hypothetical protein OROGR_025046 [Orobanche gracilis]